MEEREELWKHHREEGCIRCPTLVFRVEMGNLDSFPVSKLITDCTHREQAYIQGYNSSFTIELQRQFSNKMFTLPSKWHICGNAEMALDVQRQMER